MCRRSRFFQPDVEPRWSRVLRPRYGSEITKGGEPGRLSNLRLIVDPPKYRPNTLRPGPEEFRVGYDGITG